MIWECPKCNAGNASHIKKCVLCGYELPYDFPSEENGLENLMLTRDIAIEDNEDNMEYAGFRRRFAAYIIDWIVSLILSFIVLTMFFYLIYWTSGEEPDKAIITIILLFIPWLYWAVMESSSKQATLGKKVLGVIVTDMKGNRISFGKATARYWAKSISALILFIGFIMAGFSVKKQALHDMIAGTFVIVKR